MKLKKGTIVIVTGGGKGVGGGIVRVFAEAGAKICINYNSSESLAKKTLKQAEKAGGEAFLYQADVSDRQQVKAMVDETVRRFGGVDALVNNAALQPNRFIKEYDPEMFSWLWNINIGGYWLTTQECLPYLRKSKCGRIVNISSIHSKRPTVFDPGYAMTKAAIDMFTKETALELARDKITVNTVVLGACQIEGKTIETKFRVTRYPGEYKNSPFPLNEWTVPEDVGHLVQFLASEKASKITGAGIRLDGASMLA